jgi:hypothetical protein
MRQVPAVLSYSQPIASIEPRLTEWTTFEIVGLKGSAQGWMNPSIGHISS